MNGKQLVIERVGQVVAVTRPHFKVPVGHLTEAIASGFGYNTFAAACVDQEPVGAFDPMRFHRRFLELENQRQACAVSAVLRGYTLDLQFTPMGSAKGTTVIYQVKATVQGGIGCPSFVEFYLPTITSSRFVSDRSYGTEGSDLGQLRSGTWEGQFYSTGKYDWGRASLARSIFAALY